MPHHHSAQFVSDEDDDDEGTVVYSRTSSTTSLRSRFVVTKICEPKTITTTPGLLGAGETETESEDQPVCVCLASISRCQSFCYTSCGSSQQPVSSPPPGHWSLQPRYNSVSRRSYFPFHAGCRLFQPSLGHCTMSSVPYLLHNLLLVESTSSFQFYGCVINAFSRVHSFADSINRRS